MHFNHLNLSHFTLVFLLKICSLSPAMYKFILAQLITVRANIFTSHLECFVFATDRPITGKLCQRVDVLSVSSYPQSQTVLYCCCFLRLFLLWLNLFTFLCDTVYCCHCLCFPYLFM